MFKNSLLSAILLVNPKKRKKNLNFLFESLPHHIIQGNNLLPCELKL